MTTETTVAAWSYDASTREVRVEDHQATLTTAESRAFEYLIAHQGEVVSKRDLERDVWGLAEGVRTHTVSVTVRTLRAKLGPNGKDLLQTVYGTGWKVLPPTTEPSRNNLPRFGKPMFDRPEDREAIQRLFDDGWEMVSVVGPGGIGKTRLAVSHAEVYPGRAVFVGLGNVHDAEGLTRALLTATSMRGESLDALIRAAEGQAWLFVLDEVEQAIGPVTAAIEKLRGHRFLVTSRLPLGTPTEACHTVRGLRGAQGRAFARFQLRSSQWGHQATDEVLDGLIDCVDGNALALELIANHPSPPHKLLELLRQGGLPGEPLELALRDSYLDLDPATRNTLHRLALCEGEVPLPELVDWLGTDSERQLADLAARSLLQREEGGWRLLRTMRAFVRSQDADWPALKASWYAWLVQRVAGAEDAIYRSPTSELDSLMHLIPDLLQALREVDEVHLPRMLWVVSLVSYLHGPHSLQADATAIAVQRSPDLPLVQVLKAFVGTGVDTETFLRGLDAASPEDQLRALFLFNFSWLPRTIDLGSRPMPEVDSPLGRLQVDRLRLDRSSDPEAAVQRILETSGDYVLMRLMATFARARLFTLRGQLLTSHRMWQQLVEELEPTGLGGLHLLAVYGMADALLELDPDQAAEIYREAAELAVSYGFGGTWVVGRAGVWLALLDAWEDATPFLEQGARTQNRSTSMTCDGLLLAARVRQSSALSASVARNLDLSDIDGVLYEGTPLRDLVRHVLDAELAAREGRIHEVPEHSVALRVWRRTLQQRSASA